MAVKSVHSQDPTALSTQPDEQTFGALQRWRKDQVDVMLRNGSVTPSQVIHHGPRNATTSRTQTLSFISLPREIRDNIYHHALVVGDQGVDLWSYTGWGAMCSGGAKQINDGCVLLARRCAPALLRTCRQVNAEAAPFLYGKNTWVFSDTYAWHVAHIWLNTIGAHNRTLLKDLVLSSPVWYTKPSVTCQGWLLNVMISGEWHDLLERSHVEHLELALSPKAMFCRVRELLEEARDLRRVRLLVSGNFSRVNELTDAFERMGPLNSWASLRNACPKLQLGLVLLDVDSPYEKKPSPSAKPNNTLDNAVLLEALNAGWELEYERATHHNIPETVRNAIDITSVAKSGILDTPCLPETRAPYYHVNPAVVSSPEQLVL